MKIQEVNFDPRNAHFVIFQEGELSEDKIKNVFNRLRERFPRIGFFPIVTKTGTFEFKTATPRQVKLLKVQIDNFLQKKDEKLHKRPAKTRNKKVNPRNKKSNKK